MIKKITIILKGSMSILLTAMIILSPVKSMAISAQDARDIIEGHVFFSPEELANHKKNTAGTLTPCSIGAAAGSAGSSGTVGDVSQDGNPFHILTFPNLIDETAAATAINNFMKKTRNINPFNGLGAKIIASGKLQNVNPFLAVGHLVHESGLGTSTSASGQPAGWDGNTYTTIAGALAQNQTTRAQSHNGFGASTGSSDQHVYYRASVLIGSDADALTPPANDGYRVRTVKQWNTWEDSILGPRDWFTSIRKNYLNVGSAYESPTFAVYISHYAPRADSNNEVAYVNYLLSAIDQMTVSLARPGASPSTTCLPGATTPGGTSAGSLIKPTGKAATYLTDCGANDGNASIACTAINQLGGITYGNGGLLNPGISAGPTVLNPSFLDCSGLTNMAVYRTFGVVLKNSKGGLMCSQDYLSSPNFTTLADTRDVQPGDFIGLGGACGLGGGGHVGIVVSYDRAKKLLVTFEATGSSVSGIRGLAPAYRVYLSADGFTKNPSYTWAVRYVGPKVLQPGAN